LIRGAVDENHQDLRREFSVPLDVIRDHLNLFWPDRHKEFFTWELGPIKRVLSEFMVCRIGPDSTPEPWIYISVGASEVDLGRPYATEFVLLAPDDNARHIETLAIMTHYHATNANRLDIGRIVNCGRPWLDNSACDRFLVSLPYPFGPTLEWCHAVTGPDIRFLWLLPITSSEAAYASTHGVESLEQLFDQHQIDAIDPQREPVA
jgi:hypothetical protein